MEDFKGVLKVEAPSGPMIQRPDIRSQLPRAQQRQVGALGQILAQQAVGIFIGAAFPGVVGMSEEDLQAEPAFELGRTGEFTAVVQRQAVAFRGRQSADGLPETLGDRLGGTGLDFSCDEVAAGAIHTGQDVSLPAFAHEGIALPIAEPVAFISLFGPFVDGSFSQNVALAGGFAVGLPPGFSGNSQEGTELADALQIAPDPAIDRCVADRQTLQVRRGTVG